MNLLKSYKWLILILLAVFALLGFQHYLKMQAETGSEKKIVLWHAYTGKEVDALKKLVAEFNSDKSLNEGYHIEMLSVSFGNFSDKLTNSLPRGQGPDLFIYAHDRLEDWMSKNLLMPVDYWTDNKLLSDYDPPETINAFIKNGKLYGLPLSAKNLALYYRILPDGTDVGRKIQSLINSNRWDMKHFLTLMHELTRKCPWNKDLKCYGLGYSADDAYHHAIWLHAYGGRFINSSNKPLILTEAGIKAAELAAKIAGHHDDAVVPPELSYPLMEDLFNKGEIAAVISGPWFLSHLDPEKVKFGVTFLPEVAGRKAKPFLSVEGIYMSSKCRHPEISFKVMRFFAGKKSSEFRAIYAGQMPVLKSVVQKMKSECKTDRKCAYKLNFYDVFSEIARNSVLMPGSSAARIIWNPYGKALSAVIRRGVSPRKALKEAEWEINKYLGACINKGK